MAAPLTGLRVLEFGQFVAAPTTGLILAELGADVIKVEPPGGEPVRTGSDISLFHSLNRGKSSLAIDLKRREGVALLLRLVETTDIVVDNYLPGTLDRLGLSYDVMSARNPRLIQCGIHGFLPGPNRGRPLMDEAAQMMSGLAYMTGRPGDPIRAGASVVDYGAGIWSVVAIYGALLMRASSGRGQRIDTGLFETAVFWVSHNVAQASRTGVAPPPMPARNMASQISVTLYKLFPTADERLVFIGIAGDAQWARFCEEFALDDLWADDQLRSKAGRAARAAELEARVKAMTSRLPAAILLERLERCGVLNAAVNTPLDLLSDRHLNESGGLIDLPVADAGDLVRVPAIPIISSAYGRVPTTPAPALGEHSRAILVELGIAEEEVDRLIEARVVHEYASRAEAAAPSD